LGVGVGVGVGAGVAVHARTTAAGTFPSTVSMVNQTGSESSRSGIASHGLVCARVCACAMMSQAVVHQRAVVGDRGPGPGAGAALLHPTTRHSPLATRDSYHGALLSTPIRYKVDWAVGRALATSCAVGSGARLTQLAPVVSTRCTGTLARTTPHHTTRNGTGAFSGSWGGGAPANPNPAQVWRPASSHLAPAPRSSMCSQGCGGTRGRTVWTNQRLPRQ
jgi:hypothetical protein